MRDDIYRPGGGDKRRVETPKLVRHENLTAYAEGCDAMDARSMITNTRRGTRSTTNGSGALKHEVENSQPHLEDDVKEYPKIQSVFLRDPATQHKTFLLGEYTRESFAYLRESDWRWTEKIDGTNVRVYWDGKDVRFG